MFKRLLYIFLFLLAGVAAFAQQYPVQGSLAIASPYPANLSDYANSNIQSLALNLTLTDLTMANKRVRLKVFIQTQNATIAQSIDNISGEPLIMLDGGIPQRFTNAELAHYFRLENLQGINPDGYARSLPEGVYTIGFEVYDYFTGNKLSGRIAQTFWIIINDPPLLNTPQDKSKIADFTSGSGGNGGIIFNWTPRSSQVTNTEYEFTLCELWDPAGDPYQQFMSAIPKYQTTVSNTTTLIYNQAQPSLISGYTYAWRVRAKAKAGFEDVGLYRNDGYSNLFTFRYGDPCPAPQSLALEAKTSDAISATWDTPIGATTGGVRYKIAYRKYSAAGQWSWVETETFDLFRTISGLEPATEYELKVGVSCSPLSGESEETAFTPSQRATTLAAGQISGIECGKEPTIDLNNQKLIENLKVGDVVMANDHPHTLTKVTGSSEGWSGESWSKESLFGGIKLLFSFSNIKVNTDKQLIDGYFESVYDESQSNIINPSDAFNTMINDITTLVDDINALTTKIDDFISIIDKRNPSTEEINNLNNYINTNKQTILDNLKNTCGEAAMQKADSAFNEIQEGIDCLRNEETTPTEVEDPDTHGGPHAAETAPAPDCKQRIKNGAGTIQQLKNAAANAGKIVCGCPQDGIAQSVLNGDCESIKMRIEAIKAAYSKKEKVTIYKPTTLLSGKVSVDSLCFKHLYFDMSWVTKETTFDPATYKIEESTTNPKMGSGEKFWAIKYENILEIKISQTEPDAEKKIRALAKWLFGGNKTNDDDKSPIISVEIIRQVFGSQKNNSFIEKAQPYLNKYMKLFKINTPLRIAHFLAQVGIECKKFSGYNGLKENLNYTTCNIKYNLCQKCYTRGKNDSPKCPSEKGDCLSKYSGSSYNIQRGDMCEYPDKYAGRAEDIAMAAYSGYIGRGFIHLTHKNNYELIYNYLISKGCNPQDFLNNPLYLSDDLETAAMSACAFFEKNGGNIASDGDDFNQVMNIVNARDRNKDEKLKLLKIIKSTLQIK